MLSNDVFKIDLSHLVWEIQGPKVARFPKVAKVEYRDRIPLSL